MNPASSSPRISVVDSLRGFAVVGIILIHFLEHLNFYAFPEPSAFEQSLWDTVFYLGANKMYAIFSLLFGLSCYIQHHNQEKKGYDFRPRFAWRMLLLFFLGLLDLAIFNGDILCIYAVLGLFLIPLVKASDKVLFWTALILFCQPIELIYIVLGLFDPTQMPMNVGIGKYFGECFQACANGGFFDVALVNLKYGMQMNFGWAIGHGRLTQTLFLFVFGMILGRKRLFIDEGDNVKTWRKIGVASVFFFIVMESLMSIHESIECPAIAQSLDILITAWRNFAMMMFYVSGITVLYYRTKVRKSIIHQLSYIGKMSLTDYLLQSIIGGFLFYNWGLALYHTCSHGYSFLLGIAFCIALYFFCRWWTKHHRRGPLEELWARATWINHNNK